MLSIKGFGTFSQAKVATAVGSRATDAQLSKLSVTCPSATDLGIAATTTGVAVVVHLRVNSLRQAAETSIDFIKRGRPMIMEIKVDGGMTAAQVAALVYAAFNEYTLKFLNATLPITAAYTAGDAFVVFTATEGWFQIASNVSFLKRGDIFALDATTTKNFDTGNTVSDLSISNGDTVITLSAITGLNVGDTIQFEAYPLTDYVITDIVTSTKVLTITPALATATLPVTTNKVYKTVKGVEAINDGKYLEENVRMSTNFTADSYAINPGQVPIIGAKYTMISWESDPLSAAGGWQDHKTTDIKSTEYTRNRFTLYFNEDTCLGATGPVKYLTDWLIAGTPNIDTFKKANGASAVDTANFIA